MPRSSRTGAASVIRCSRCGCRRSAAEAAESARSAARESAAPEAAAAAGAGAVLVPVVVVGATVPITMVSPAVSPRRDLGAVVADHAERHVGDDGLVGLGIHDLDRRGAVRGRDRGGRHVERVGRARRDGDGDLGGLAEAQPSGILSRVMVVA